MSCTPRLRTVDRLHRERGEDGVAPHHPQAHGAAGGPVVLDREPALPRVLDAHAHGPPHWRAPAASTTRTAPSVGGVGTATEPSSVLVRPLDRLSTRRPVFGTHAAK